MSRADVEKPRSGFVTPLFRHVLNRYVMVLLSDTCRETMRRLAWKKRENIINQVTTNNNFKDNQLQWLEWHAARKANAHQRWPPLTHCNKIMTDWIDRKLEVRGRARREAPRRRKSEWTVNSSIRNSSRNNATSRMTPKSVYSKTTWQMELRQFTVYEHFGCVNICPHTFFLCGPKFTTSLGKLC